MSTFWITTWVLFGCAFVGFSLVFFFYPVGLTLLYFVLGKRREYSEATPSVTVLVPVRNGEGLVAEKIENTLELDYPSEQLEIVIYSDGSTDRTIEIIEGYKDRGVRLMFSEEHLGKADALNTAVPQCTTELIVFSDADALLRRDALKKMVRHSDDPKVGGVCGQRVMATKQGNLERPQQSYITVDSAVKIMESQLSSITSNDGKLYCIRRELYRTVDSAVTDDSFVCLNVIHQHYRFHFEPEAEAEIPTPSRSARHELSRRRRVVARSMRGLYLMRGLLNPLRYGVFSVSLGINKVLRRFFPLCLLVLLITTGILAWEYWPLRVFLGLQLLFYGLAVLQPWISRVIKKGPIARVASLAFYFTLGACGTFLGCLDFLRRRRVTKWDPIKADPNPTT